MEFLPSNMLGHADGISRMIPTFSVPLENRAEKGCKIYVTQYSKGAANDFR